MRFERSDTIGSGSQGNFYAYRISDKKKGDFEETAHSRKPRIRMLQITDIQLSDPSSPNRFEFVNKLIDIEAARPFIPGHRPSELLTPHAAIAAVEKANSIHEQREVQVALFTGDIIYSAQRNEAEAVLAIIEGGELDPQTIFGTYEGVQSATIDDPFYYKPDASSDLMGEMYGFPRIKGYLDAALGRQKSPGLKMPWLMANGNHEVLVQGMGAQSKVASNYAQGGQKPTGFSTTDIDFGSLAKRYEGDASALQPIVTTTSVAPLDSRRLLADGEFGAMVRDTKGLPVGHGLSSYEFGEMNYSTYFAEGDFVVIAIDTANRAGGARGVITEYCFRTLEEHLDLARATYPTALIIVISHHSLSEINFDESSVTLGVVETLMSSNRVFLWLSGHTHRDRVISNSSNPARTFVEVTSASIADWPSTIREIEIFDDVSSGKVTLYLRSHTVAEHVRYISYGEVVTGEISELLSIHSAIIANTAAIYGLDVQGTELKEIKIECDRERYL